MLAIMLFLLVLSLVLTYINKRISLFMFPDSVQVTKTQSFLSWFGMAGVFVSLPFLWDGDYSNGLYPFVSGLISFTLAIVLVFISNSNLNTQFVQYEKIYLNSDETLVVPGNDTYGFLDGALKRIKQIGPKYYFKELQAREKACSSLALSLMNDSVEETLSNMRTLPWVVDNAVSDKAQFIFLMQYLLNRFDREKLYSNFSLIIKNALSLGSLIGLKLNDYPYPLAKIIAENESLMCLLGRQNGTNFVIDVDSYICDDDENVVCVFSARRFDIVNQDNAFIDKLQFFYKKLLSVADTYIILTNTHVIICCGESQTVLDIESQVFLTKQNDCFSFDEKIYFSVDDPDYFSYVMDTVLHKKS